MSVGPNPKAGLPAANRVEVGVAARPAAVQQAAVGVGEAADAARRRWHWRHSSETRRRQLELRRAMRQPADGRVRRRRWLERWCVAAVSAGRRPVVTMRFGRRRPVEAEQRRVVGVLGCRRRRPHCPRRRRQRCAHRHRHRHAQRRRLRAV